MKRSRRVLDLTSLTASEDTHDDLCLSSSFLKKCKCEDEIRKLNDIKSSSGEYKLSFSEVSDISEGEDDDNFHGVVQEARKPSIFRPSSSSAFELRESTTFKYVEHETSNNSISPRIGVGPKSIAFSRHNSPVTVTRRSSFDTRISFTETTVCSH